MTFPMSLMQTGFMNGKSAGKFDPNGNVTVAEGITMAARLHAIYNGNEITEKKAENNEFRLEFDSMQNVAIRANTTIGKVEDGVLVLEAKAPNASGGYDLGANISGLDLDARDYNKIVVHMKREVRPNINNNFREDRLEIFYTTSTSNQFDMQKYLPVALYKRTDLDDGWFDVEINVTAPLWKDYITGIRIDPSNDNGVYYIDYIAFSKGETKVEKKWYEMYVDYAVENGIVDRGQYVSSTFTKNITRAELCELFAAALPESNYAPINDVKGIPDVMRDEKNSDIYLMLYKAGILLGSDAAGTFNPKSDIKRSEVAAIINRAALPENRVKGTISADWSKQGNEYDLEFNDESDLAGLSFEAESTEVKNGALVLKARDRGPKASPQYDPRIIVENVNIDTDIFTKLKVRLKVEFDESIEDKNTTYEFFFTTEEGESFSPAKLVYADLLKTATVDPAGWYVLEVDLATRNTWTGNVNAFRFDPVNTGCTLIVDYIRLAKADMLQGASHEKLISEGYNATRLLQDEGFERGFYVTHYEQKQVDLEQRKWQYASTEKPLWLLGAIWCNHDLYDNRDASKPANVIADTYGINEVAYNAEEKSLKLHLDATKVYNGQAHDNAKQNWWPHLLIEQKEEVASFNKKRNSAAADRMFVEFDVKLSDFKYTTNTDGINACQFLAYFYLMTDKAPGQRIWFGLSIFDDRMGGNKKLVPSWQPDSAARMYMYGIPEAVVYDGIENSLTPERGTYSVSNEWKHVRLDVTPHIERAIEWANRDKIFGADVTLTKEDMYFSGANIGFEIHGNYDATFEIKNFNMVSYDK